MDRSVVDIVNLTIGLKPSDAHPCLFTAGEGPQTVKVGLYVDDALILGTLERCAEFVAKLQKESEIKDGGPLKPGAPRKFLGMEMERKGGDLLGIIMKREVYAKSVVQKPCNLLLLYRNSCLVAVQCSRLWCLGLS
jgi:hypothetical protein